MATRKSNHPPTDRSPALWKLRLALVAIVLAAYSNAFGLGSALDGDTIVSGDQRTHAATWENVRTIFATDYWWPHSADRLYRPLTVLSGLFNYSILGNESRPAGYHAVNIALHAANALLLFALALRLFGRRWPAFFAAALWAAHPLGVETVTNIAGRADLLATAALLGGVLVYAGGARTAGRLAALFGLALAAPMAKETGVMLLPLMALWDAAQGKLRIAEIGARVPAYAAAAAALPIYFFARAAALARIPWPSEYFVDNPLRGAGFWEARWTAVRLLGADLWLLVWPARLTWDRSYSQIPIATAADWGAWLALLTVTALGVAIVVRRRQDPQLVWAGGLFLVTLLPASNLLVLIGATMAERFLYLPAAGFAIAAATVAYRTAPARAAAVLTAVAILFAGRTFARNQDWESNLSITAHDVTVSSRSFRAHNYFGQYLLAADPQNLDRAIAEVETGWSIQASLPDELNYSATPGLLGALYEVKAERVGNATTDGRMWNAKAVEVLLRAERISRAEQRAYDEKQARHGKPVPPRRPTQGIGNNLGKAYWALGRYGEALDALRAAREIAPADAPAYESAVGVYTSMGDPAGAALLGLERVLAAEANAQTLPVVAQLYAKLPDGACAVTVRNGAAALNTDCPRLRADLCRALPELSRTFRAGRLRAKAEEFERRAAELQCSGRGPR